MAMSDMFELCQFLNNDSNHPDAAWTNQFQTDYDIMTSLNGASDYVDLDDLLDIGGPGDILGNATHSSSSSYFVEDYSDVLEFYSDQTDAAGSFPTSQSQIEHEQAKLAKENEAGLLEALQKSMDNIECDTVSDLVSLSSTLNQPPVLSSNPYQAINVSVNAISHESIPSSTTGTPTDPTVDSDDSVLKQLLLSPTNTNYPREVDANNLDSCNGMMEHIAEQTTPKVTGNSVNPITEPKKKRAKKLAKKPFTELLKHMDASSVNPKSPGTAKPSTRVLNVSKYMRQYGSAPTSRIPSPTGEEKNVQQSVSSKVALSTHPVLTAKLSLSSTQSLSNMKVPVSVKKTTKNQKTKKANDMIVAPDMNSLLNMLEEKQTNGLRLSQGCKDGRGKLFRPASDKRRSAMLIEPLPKKRPRSNTDDPKSTQSSGLKIPECTEQPSREHDYCQTSEIKNPTPPPLPPENILTAALQASGLSVKAPPTEPPAEATSVKPNVPSTKILKWEEYLQRVRLGVRSAPNSPTSSPKIIRGSARPVINFMSIGNAVISKPVRKQVSQLVDPIVAAKTPKKKPVMRLEEFQEYLAKLLSNEHLKSQESSATDDVVTAANCDSTNKVMQCEQNLSKGKTAASIHNGSRSKGDFKPTRNQPLSVNLLGSPSQPYIKISSGGIIHTAAVTSAQTISSNSTPVVMFRLPTNESNNVSAVSETQPLTVQCSSLSNTLTVKPANTICSPAVASQSSVPNSIHAESKILGPLNDPRLLNKGKPQPVSVLKAIPRMKWTSVESKNPKFAKAAAKTSEALASAPGPVPTFKLITSNKDGMETQSLILNGVSGKLKEILTLLSKQQQQNQQTTLGSTVVNPQQQKTLEQLLKAITNLKANRSEAPAATVSTVPGTSTFTTDTARTPQTVVKTIGTACGKKVIATKKGPNVPSPLSLIYEIKQNMNKKTELVKKQPAPKQPRFVYTPPACSTSVTRHSPCQLSSGSDTLATPSESIPTVSCNTQSPSSLVYTGGSPSVFSKNSLNSAAALNCANIASSAPKVSHINNVVPGTQITVYVDSSAAAEAKQRLLEVKSIKTTAPAGIQTVGEDKESSVSTGPDSNASTGTPIEKEDYSIKKISNFAEICSDINVRDRLDNSLSHNEIHDAVVDIGNKVDCITDSNVTSLKSSTNLTLNAVPVLNEVSHKEDICKLGNTGTLQQDTSLVKSETKSPDKIEANPTEITIGEPVEDIITLSDVGNVVDVETGVEEGEISDDAPHYYNKLPAYFYSGKLLTTDSSELAITSAGTATSVETLKHSGLKELSFDPVVGLERDSDQEQNVHYNKLPHYLSSGKLGARPHDHSAVGNSGDVMRRSSSGSLKRGLSFSTKVKCTPSGTVIDPSETFYSRLPSYYSYGRTHIVDTVTEPPDEPDATVTQETLKQDEDRRKSKKKRRKQKKRRRKKHKREVDKRLDGDRILYSKLPSYLLSGRIPLVPERASSVQSCSTSQSLTSDSDQDSISSFRRRVYSQPFSPGHRSLPSPSSSRSRSRSPRRSWAGERSKYRDESSSSRRSYRSYSSDSDYDLQRPKRRRRHSGSNEPDRSYSRWRKREQEEQERKNQAIQQRRVMYVGRISDTVSKNELKIRFQKFGHIDDVALHFRKEKDSYAFVTFRYKCDTVAAIEHGNDGDVEPQYDLSFGGRRHFCKVEYADLDEERENDRPTDAFEEDFDTLLKMHR